MIYRISHKFKDKVYVYINSSGGKIKTTKLKQNEIKKKKIF